MVKTLTSWRTLLLLVVVIYHCDQQWLMEPTKAAVSIFFISSGFLLSMRHPVERFSWSGWKRFVLHSASKLYPLQWLGLAILLLFQWIFIVPKVDASLLAHVALVQSWIPVREIFFGYNGHAWFLASLLFCYLCYPLLNYLAHRTRLWQQCLFMAVVTVVFAVSLPHTTGAQREFLYVFPLIRVWDFVLGIVLHGLYRACGKTDFSPSRLLATVIEVVVLLLFLELILINKKTDYITPYEDFLTWWLPMGAVVFSTAMLHGREGYLGRALMCRPLQWLGQLGFELYVFQGIAALVFNYLVAPVFGHFGIIVYGDYVWGVLPILIPLAWVVNRCFSRPVGRWLSSRFPNT